MITQRNSFGICSSKEWIYFIGGENKRNGSLVKCEKFDVFKKQCFPINFLNYNTSNLTVCNYKDQYLLKCGGSENKNMFEIYTISSDKWEPIDFENKSKF